METLNYKVLEGTGYNGYILKDAPVKVMQFGEGNFLRAFVDYFYDIANEKAGYNGKVKLVQPISNFPQMADWINEQEGLYTLYLRGSEKGQKVDAKRVISCVSDCVCPYIDGKWDEVLELARSEDLETIVSNTTEAGIAYTQGDSQFDQVPPAFVCSCWTFVAGCFDVDIKNQSFRRSLWRIASHPAIFSKLRRTASL